MILTTATNLPKDELPAIQNYLNNMGTHAMPIEWKGQSIFILNNASLSEQDMSALRTLGINESISSSHQYELVSREFTPEDSTILVGNIPVGGRAIQVISGPCSVESSAQMHMAASGIKNAGSRMLRGGAYKPRTSPYSFQGHGRQGLEMLCDAARPLGLPVVTELMDIRHLDLFLEFGIDAIQIGTRNMQNFDLLREIGQCEVPVILKRGMSATISEWLMAAEYVASGGNPNIILCERGIRTFETAYRNVLDVTGVIVAKKETHLPVIIDPSHAGGQAWMVPALSQAAIAVGADGLLIEVHPAPKEAWCDADQALDLDEFGVLMTSLDAVACAIGRSLL